MLYACPAEALIAQAQRPAGQVADIPAASAALQGLGYVNTALVHRVAAQGQCHKATWTLFEDRPEETAHWAEVEFTPGDWRKDAWPLRYLVLRIRTKQGSSSPRGPTTKYLAVVSNRAGEGPRGPPRLALAEGGDDRAGARRDQERARGRHPPLRALRRECGLVSSQPAHLQRAERA